MRVAALVLAAGSSTRMGRPKALLPLGGATFVERVVASAIAGGASRVVVVVGPRDGATIGQVVLRSDHGGRVEVALNPRPDEGMASSVRVGLSALAARAPSSHDATDATDAALIWPVDAPLVRAETVAAILAAGDGAPGLLRRSIVSPRHAGRGGHPILVGRDHHAAIAALPPGVGLRSLMAVRADAIVRLPVDDPFVIDDIDTPDDYARTLLAVASPRQA